MFLNKFQEFLKSLKGCQELLVTISQEFVLIDEGISFVLQRFKGCRFAIMGRREVWETTGWTGEGESSSILVLSAEVGASER